MALELESNILLAPYTTYKIGGPADYFIPAKTPEELIEAITYAQEQKLPYFVLGAGANILISDRGFRGLVIKNEIAEVTFADTQLTAGSGATIADLIEASAQRGLSGLEHFAGIPSTVGGALWQNLHFLSPDRTETLFIESILAGAKVFSPKEGVRDVGKEFFSFGYDYSILHDTDDIVLEATFNFTPSTEAAIRAQAQKNLAWRNEKQPSLETFPSCGSVFKKIEGVGAGRLIQDAGLKGYRIGNIQVSEQHANFLVNLGGGKAEDVRALIAHIQKEVREKTGYSLETEIEFVGE